MSAGRNWWRELLDGKRDSTSHGAAGWGRKDEYINLLSDESEGLAAGALMLGPSPWRGKRLDLGYEMASRHVCVIGPPGSGKTRGLFLWNYAHYKGTFFGTDPKSEAWKLTSGLQKRPWRFAPRDPDNSAPFNWIPLCGRDAHLCLTLARAVVAAGDSEHSSESFWTRAETMLLAALFAHASTFRYPTPAAAYDFLTGRSGDALVDALMSSRNRIAREYATLFSNSDKKLRGNIIIGAATTLVWLGDERVRRFTSASTNPPCFGDARRREISVYWCLAENDVTILKPLSALFFTLALHQLKEAEGPVPVTFLLDEAFNIGRIAGLETEIAVLRGRGIGLTLGCQSRSQFGAVYGRDRGQVIADNINTWVTLAGLDYDSAEVVSKSLGEYTFEEERVTRSSRGWWEMPSVSKTMVKNARPLLTPDEVRRIKEREQIIVTTNRRPLLMERYWYTDGERERRMKPLGAALTHAEKRDPKGGGVSSSSTGGEDAEIMEACLAPEGL